MAGKDRRLVLAALDQFRGSPFKGDVLRLTGRPIQYRRRVGNWRIFFEADSDTLEVLVAHIRRRTITTYKKP
ncbi:MAG: hypothetical protein O7A04_09320 [Acidobacteria bacterium]|nr:hypothetical protein [Acidobacteriota bacterium]